MTLRFETIKEKKVVGIHSKMLPQDYAKIVSLWQEFMPQRETVQNTISDELIAMQVYSETVDGTKKPEVPFQMWACAEVSNFKIVPDMMTPFSIPGGLYAVFHLKGIDGRGLYQQILSEWLPSSGYAFDARTHFQVMGSAYKNGSPDSEEDFWVPVKRITT